MTSQANKLYQSVLRYRAALEQYGQTRAVQYARLAASLEKQIVQMLRTIDGRTITTAERTRLLNALRRAFLTTARSALQLSAADAAPIVTLAIRRQLDVAKTERLVRTLAYWERSIQTGEVVGLTQGIREQRIAGQFASTYEPVLRKTGRVFADAVETGLSPLEIAKRVPELGTLTDATGAPLRGRINPEAFGRAVTRTAFNEISNSMALRIGEEAGLTKYVNLGVSDSRQSDVCYRASQAGPRTLKEWANSSEGPPPRHVLNCRCTLQAIPDEIAGEDWTQPNPDVEARMERMAA